MKSDHEEWLKQRKLKIAAKNKPPVRVIPMTDYHPRFIGRIDPMWGMALLPLMVMNARRRKMNFFGKPRRKQDAN